TPPPTMEPNKGRQPAGIQSIAIRIHFIYCAEEYILAQPIIFHWVITECKATPDHNLFCAGLEREDIYSSPLLVYDILRTLGLGHFQPAADRRNYNNNNKQR
ncbi:hypothetical protein TNCV_2435211, partial [Trichonephila clavipes]